MHTIFNTKCTKKAEIVQWCIFLSVTNRQNHLKYFTSIRSCLWGKNTCWYYYNCDIQVAKLLSSLQHLIIIIFADVFDGDKNIKFTVGGALISKISLLRFNGNDGTHMWCCWVGDTKMTLRNYIILPTSNTIKSNTRRYAIWSSSSFSSPSSWEFNCIKISPWSFILISLSFCSPSFFISPCPSWLLTTRCT